MLVGSSLLFVRSVVVLLRVDRCNRATVVISGVDVVSRLWVILRLPRAPHLDRGRS
jgi:hypothetical protein